MCMLLCETLYSFAFTICSRVLSARFFVVVVVFTFKNFFLNNYFLFLILITLFYFLTLFYPLSFFLSFYFFSLLF